MTTDPLVELLARGLAYGRTPEEREGAMDREEEWWTTPRYLAEQIVTAIPEAQREALLLGLAWAEAAAALPQGGYLDLAMWPDLPVEQRYEAEAAPVQEGEWGLHSGGYARSAPTASAALQALTVALREHQS